MIRDSETLLQENITYVLLYYTFVHPQSKFKNSNKNKVNASSPQSYPQHFSYTTDIAVYLNLKTIPNQSRLHPV